MTPQEALEVVALVQAEWPMRELPDETIQAWAFGILEFEQTDALEAVRTLAALNRFPPALAEIVEATDDERRHRAQAEAESRMLPSPAPEFVPLDAFLRSRPDMAARVKKLGVWGKTLTNLDNA